MSLNFKFKSHVFKQSLDEYTIDKDYPTVQDVLDAIPEKYDRQYLHVKINLEDVFDFDRVIKDSEDVLVVFVPQKGDGDKNVMNMIAMIAISAIAPGVGGDLASGLKLGAKATKIASAIFAAGFTYVASLVVNAVFPPSTNRNNQLVNADPAESAILSIQGARNQLKPYYPALTFYGEHKIVPPLCAESYTLHSGDDTYLCMLFDCGQGNVNVYDMKFGEDKFLNAYEDIEYYIHKDLHDGGSLNIYTSDVDQEDYSLLCEYNNPQIVTTELNTDKAIVDISFLQGLAYFNDKGSRQVTSVSFDVEYREVGETTWSKAAGNKIKFSSEAVSVDDHEGIFIIPEYDEVKYLLSDRYNWGYKAGTKDIHIAIKGYTPAVGDWMYISGYAKQIDAVTAKGGDYYIVSFNTAPFEGDFACTFYQKYNYHYNLGSTFIGLLGHVYDVTAVDSTRNPYANISGGDLKIRKGGTDIKTLEVTKATMQPFTVGIELIFPSRGQYEIQVTRVTEDSASDRLQNAMTLTALRSIKNISPLALTHQRTILEMKVRANDQLNGVIDDFNFIGKRVLPVYDGVSWSNEETTNPSWIVYNILTQDAPRPVPSSRLDLDSFEELSDWCDQLNADGEAKYTVSHVVDYNTTVKELVNNILSSCRASLSTVDVKYKAIIDTTKTSVGLITPRNSWNFSGNRVFIDTPHALKTTFIDRDANYEIREIMVYADGYDESTATVIQSYDTFGVTNYKQAWALARYFIAQGIHRSNTISFDMDVENLIFTRGDVFEYQNDIIRNGGTSVRILEHNVVGGKSQLTVDDTVSGTVTGVIIRVASGELITSSASQISTNVIECASEVTGISQYDLVVYGAVDSLTKKYLIKSISYKADLVATIEAVDYAPQIFDADTGTIPAYDSGAVYNNQNTPPDYVRDIVVNEDIQYKDRYPFISVALNWKPANNSFPRAYEIYSKNDDGKWKLVDTVYNPPYLFIDSVKQDKLDIFNKVFEFKVLAVSATGLKKDLNQAETVTFKVAKDTFAPKYVGKHDWTTEGDRLKLTWTNPDDIDFDGVEIRRQSDGRGWADSQIVYRSSYLESSCLLDPVEGKYYLRSVDTSGNYSEAIAEVDVAFVAPVISNLSARVDGDKIFLQFDKDSGSFNIKEYDVYFNNENQVYKTYDTEKIYLPILRDSESTISIKAKNVIGVYSAKVSTTLKTYLYGEYELYENAGSSQGNLELNSYNSTLSDIYNNARYYLPNFIYDISGPFTSIKDLYNGGMTNLETANEVHVYVELFSAYNILNLLVEVNITNSSGEDFYFEGSGTDISSSGGWFDELIDGDNIIETKATGINKFIVKERDFFRVGVEKLVHYTGALPTFTVKTYGKIEEETGREVNIPATGTVGATITYQYKYAGSTADYTDNTPIAIIENGNAGDYIVFSNQTETTVDVSLFDSTNTRISGTINWTKRGIRKG